MKKFIKTFKLLINLFNELLTEILNKLNFSNYKIKKKDIKFKKELITGSSLIFLTILFYLSGPGFFKKDQLQIKLQDTLKDKYNLNFELEEDFNYSFILTPHINVNKFTITDDDGTELIFGKIKIYLSYKNLINLDKLKIKNLKISDANLKLKNGNLKKIFSNFNKKLSSDEIIATTSKILFLNKEDDIFSIINIYNLKSYHDIENATNKMKIAGEVFGYPFDFRFNNELDNKIYKLNLSFEDLKLNLSSELNLQKKIKRGFLKISSIGLNLNNDIVINEDKIDFKSKNELNSRLTYKGQIDLKPFNLNLFSNFKNFDLNYILGNDTIFKELIRSKILFNENLNYKIKLVSENLNQKYFDRLNLNIIFNQDNLSFSNSTLKFKDIGNIKISNTKLYNENDLSYLRGSLEILIDNQDKFFSFFLVPKIYRKKLDKISIDFQYNFNENIVDFIGFKIDDRMSMNEQNLLNNLNKSKDIFNNKIQFRRVVNDILENYDG